MATHSQGEIRQPTALSGASKASSSRHVGVGRPAYVTAVHGGFTLIEMLVAMAITLVMMGGGGDAVCQYQQQRAQSPGDDGDVWPAAARAECVAAGFAGGDLSGRDVAAAGVEPRVHRDYRRAVSRRVRDQFDRRGSERCQSTNWPPTDSIRKSIIRHRRFRRAICSRSRIRLGRRTAAGWAIPTTF